MVCELEHALWKKAMTCELDQSIIKHVVEESNGVQLCPVSSSRKRLKANILLLGIEHELLCIKIRWARRE